MCREVSHLSNKHLFRPAVCYDEIVARENAARNGKWRDIMREQALHTIVVGSGAAGFSAALRLDRLGVGDLALITENRRLRELGKRAEESCTLELITAEDTVGRDTYRRSLNLLLLTSLHDVLSYSKTPRNLQGFQSRINRSFAPDQS